ncbi:hypothetical protein J421_1003 [Gemmatirosa kalamazoonensis]|uniref:O-antigen ligase-related domain-containing protein n=1 Tax=Gemmatirosa kalamazoonensis TaxID=861299 RepID=W0RDY5_9BACT|nr:O-antigen ligase family protein [Gemmatirosa kalamazoonensis]AHG88540.1 hypothetical protein J421_1003 [Gemmatirosa kalamazoonensis]
MTSSGLAPAITSSDRLALRTLQVGAVAVPLAVTSYKIFELDRFFLPKELVVHLCAALCAALCIGRRPLPASVAGARPIGGGEPFLSARPVSQGLTWVDLALVLFLALSLASCFAAPNPWLAARALSISLAGAALFWSARHLATRGIGDQVVAIAGAACAIAAATSLLQAYGVRTDFFSLNRAPGGTFGNRNFVAHLSAIGGPLLVYTVLRARGVPGALGAALGLAATTAALVLSRSRGAYLATAASIPPLAIGLWRAGKLPGARPGVMRAAMLAAAIGVGAAGALTVPNTLNWKTNSDNPYLESVRGVVDYRSGSGKGRLKQYTNSVKMTAAHPLLGVGTGNWSVRYPRYAPDGDPSLVDGNMTANPWPSSDWVAVLSERGPAALLALGGVLLGLAVWAHAAAWRARQAEEALAGGVLGATLLATVVVGTFDAVILLAAPAFVAWTAFGALAERSGSPTMAGRVLRPPRGLRRLGALALALLLIASAVRSLGQTIAMGLFSTGNASAIAMAARLDPGSYRVRVRQAEIASGRRRCEAALAARSLYPEADAARRLASGCRRPTSTARRRAGGA